MRHLTMCLNAVRRYFKETFMLLRAIPSIIVALFIISLITMNLLANKTIVQTEWIALDAGILMSWLSFLCMDIVTKHFGPRAANRLTLFAIFINLLVCLIFYIASVIPSSADDYSVFNTIIGGTWFILLSSTIAFLCAGIINNCLNYAIGKLFKKNPDGSLAFITRAYISTFIGQFFDNLIFALLTFMVFAPIFWDGFSWTFVQCLTCSVVGAALELVLEIVFSPIGYRISKKWKQEDVGKQYFDLVARNKNENTCNR